MQLMNYVTSLENRDNRTRCDQVLAALRALGIEPIIQECRWPRIRNIIVDFSPDHEEQQVLFTAHYDAVLNSPGANDNASGVAVLLGLCHMNSDLAAYPFKSSS
ncbi:MAG: Zn-dependent exopeptidase M28 [Planctomycetes bacterium]|nr:Zn-dependent exopeptidase M28 [Planctomycetota bacterium]